MPLVASYVQKCVCMLEPCWEQPWFHLSDMYWMMTMLIGLLLPCGCWQGRTNCQMPVWFIVQLLELQNHATWATWLAWACGVLALISHTSHLFLVCPKTWTSSSLHNSLGFLETVMQCQIHSLSAFLLFEFFVLCCQPKSCIGKTWSWSSWTCCHGHESQVENQFPYPQCLGKSVNTN